jgi:hypothetical protein
VPSPAACSCIPSAAPACIAAWPPSALALRTQPAHLALQVSDPTGAKGRVIRKRLAELAGRESEQLTRFRRYGVTMVALRFQAGLGEEPAAAALQDDLHTAAAAPHQANLAREQVQHRARRITRAEDRLALRKRRVLRGLAQRGRHEGETRMARAQAGPVDRLARVAPVPGDRRCDRRESSR